MASALTRLNRATAFGEGVATASQRARGFSGIAAAGAPTDSSSAHNCNPSRRVERDPVS